MGLTVLDNSPLPPVFVLVSAAILISSAFDAACVMKNKIFQTLQVQILWTTRQTVSLAL